MKFEKTNILVGEMGTELQTFISFPSMQRTTQKEQVRFIHWRVSAILYTYVFNSQG